VIFIVLLISMIRENPFKVGEQAENSHSGCLPAFLDKLLFWILSIASFGLILVWFVTTIIASATNNHNFLGFNKSVPIFYNTMSYFDATSQIWIEFFCAFGLFVYYYHSTRSASVTATAFFGNVVALGCWIAMVYPLMYNYSTSHVYPASSDPTTHAVQCPDSDESFKFDSSDELCYYSSGTGLYSVLMGFAQIGFTGILGLQFLCSFCKSFVSVSTNWIQKLVFLISLVAVAALGLAALPLFKTIPNDDNAYVATSTYLVITGYPRLFAFAFAAIAASFGFVFAGTGNGIGEQWLPIAESISWGASVIFWTIFPWMAWYLKNQAGSIFGSYLAPCDGGIYGDRLCDEYSASTAGLGIFAIAVALNSILISVSRFSKVNTSTQATE